MRSLLKHINVFFALLLLLSVCSGCGWDPFGIHDPVKDAVGAIDRAISMLQNTSKDWQEVLKETQDKLTSDAQSTIRNEVDTAFNRAIAATGTEFRCNLDFVRDRLVQDLTRIKAKLLNQSIPDKEPAFCQVVPPSVDASLVPERLKWIEFSGYDFDTPGIQVFLQNDDQYIDITKTCLSIPSHYLMTLDLVSQGCELSQKSRGFVLKWNNREISSIKVSQVPNPPTAIPGPDRRLGPVGGGGGSEFVDVVPSGAKVIALQIRSGDRVDSIQAFLDTGPLTKHGGGGGDFHEIQFTEGEYITAVYGRYGTLLDQIAVRTNKASYGPYGGGGGGPFSFEAPVGFQIVGFFGRSGDEMDALGVIMRQR